MFWLNVEGNLSLCLRMYLSFYLGILGFNGLYLSLWLSKIPIIRKQKSAATATLFVLSPMRFYFNPRFLSRGSMPGSLPRKLMYICIASSMPPGVRIYLRYLAATSLLKMSPVSLYAS